MACFFYTIAGVSGCEAGIAKMAKLVEKKKQIECKEILELLKTTPRSFDEIKAFLRGENPDEEEE